MASKQIKAKKVVAAQRPAGQAHTLWLAGLGAVSLTQKRVVKAYAGLVSEGQALQQRARLSAVKFYGEAQARLQSTLQPLSKKAADVAIKANNQVESNISAVLERLGVAPKTKAKAQTKRTVTRSKQLKLAR